MMKSPYLLSFIILLLALAVRLTTLGNTFIVNDETLYWEWSNRFWLAFLNLDFHGTLVGKGYPSITVFWVHGLGLLLTYLLQGREVAHEWLTQPLIFNVLGQRRLVMAGVNALLFVPIFWQARALLGSGHAFWGTAAMAITPFLVADSRTMRGDSLMCSLMIISLLSWLIFLRKPQRRQLLLSAVTFGLAFLTKITAIPLVGVIILATAVYLGRQPQRAWMARLRWGIGVLAAWGILAIITIFAMWPALWVAPIEVWQFITAYVDESVDGRLNYFFGHLTHSEPLHLFYPVAFLFRATPMMVIGCLIITLGLTIHSYRLTRQRRPLPFPPTIYWTLLALLAYCIIYGMVLDFGALKRDRYLMPIFPATALIAAVGWRWLIKQASRPQWVRIIVILLLMVEVGDILSTHPYYYTYWSPLMGGGRVAEASMLAESGVESEAFVTLSQRPNAVNETIAILTARDFRPAYVGKTVRFLDNDAWVTANYILLRQYHYQTEKFDPDMIAYLYRQPPLEIIEYKGYRWGWVYPGPAAQVYVGDKLERYATLYGYSLSNSKLVAGDTLSMTAYIRNQGQQSTDRFYLRLVDSEGYMWAETSLKPRPTFAEAFQKQGQIAEAEAQLPLPIGMMAGQYILRMGYDNLSTGQTIGEFKLPDEGDNVLVTLPASFPPANPLTIPHFMSATITLSQALTLHGYTASSNHVKPNDGLWLTLYWETLQPIKADYVLNLQLLDSQNKEVAYWLGRPARSSLPTNEWQIHQQVQDPWRLTIPPETLPGRYHIALLVYDAATQQLVNQTALAEIEVLP